MSRKLTTAQRLIVSLEKNAKEYYAPIRKEMNKLLKKVRANEERNDSKTNDEIFK